MIEIFLLKWVEIDRSGLKLVERDLSMTRTCPKRNINECRVFSFLRLKSLEIMFHMCFIEYFPYIGEHSSVGSLVTITTDSSSFQI